MRKPPSSSPTCGGRYWHFASWYITLVRFGVVHSLTALKAYIGSATTTLVVCDNQKAKYNRGECATPPEQRRARLSLWFAYAVDVASDLTGSYHKSRYMNST